MLRRSLSFERSTILILFSCAVLILLLFSSCTPQNDAVEDNDTNIPSLDESCVCIALYDPVCGVDGKTYSNSCVAGCAGVAVAAEGPCA